MKKNIVKRLGFTLILTFMVAGTASADFITGEIAFTGEWEPAYWDSSDTGSWIGTDISSSTAIKFSEVDTNGFNATTNYAVGSFAGLKSDVINAQLNSFQFDPFSKNITPLWKVGDFEFDLTNIVSVFKPNTGSILNIVGTGTVRHNGNLDDTDGTWVFTGQSATWSSSTSPVPEPATMLLFGTGLIGLAGIARRKKTKVIKFNGVIRITYKFNLLD